MCKNIIFLLHNIDHIKKWKQYCHNHRSNDDSHPNNNYWFDHGREIFYEDIDFFLKFLRNFE